VPYVHLSHRIAKEIIIIGMIARRAVLTGCALPAMALLNARSKVGPDAMPPMILTGIARRGSMFAAPAVANPIGYSASVAAMPLLRADDKPFRIMFAPKPPEKPAPKSINGSGLIAVCS
jgi:hypothetical protein